jgi:pimeloyl-ACP methyl ester carboxylesterase
MERRVATRAVVHGTSDRARSPRGRALEPQRRYPHPRARVADLVAVLTKLGVERSVLLGYLSSGAMNALLAATRPELVRSASGSSRSRGSRDRTTTRGATRGNGSTTNWRTCPPGAPSTTPSGSWTTKRRTASRSVPTVTRPPRHWHGSAEERAPRTRRVTSRGSGTRRTYGACCRACRRPPSY